MILTKKAMKGWIFFTKEMKKDRIVSNQKKKMWNKVNMWLQEFDEKKKEKE